MIATTLPGLDIRPIHWGNREAEAKFAVKQTRVVLIATGARRLGTTFRGPLTVPIADLCFPQGVKTAHAPFRPLTGTDTRSEGAGRSCTQFSISLRPWPAIAAAVL
jgi:hypothetical protein